MVAQMLSQETKTQIHPNYLSQILEKLSLLFFFKNNMAGCPHKTIKQVKHIHR